MRPPVSGPSGVLLRGLLRAWRCHRRQPPRVGGLRPRRPAGRGVVPIRPGPTPTGRRQPGPGGRRPAATPWRRAPPTGAGRIRVPPATTSRSSACRALAVATSESSSSGMTRRDSRSCCGRAESSPSPPFRELRAGALWMKSQGLRWVAPVERIEPPALFDYLSSRRGPRAGRRAGDLASGGRRVRSRCATMSWWPSPPIATSAAPRSPSSSSATLPACPQPRRRWPCGPVPQSSWQHPPDRARALRGRVEPSTGRPQATGGPISRSSPAHHGHARSADRGGAEQWWGAFQPVWDDLTTETVNR